MADNKRANLTPYEPPVIPRHWRLEEQMYARRVNQLFDELYATIARLKQEIHSLKEAKTSNETI